MTKLDIAIYWTLSLFAALTIVVGRLGMVLFGVGDLPPDDPGQRAHWDSKRRWLLFSELAALPAFATVAVSVTIYFNLPAIASVAFAMILGALGFGFLLNGVKRVALRKIKEMEP